jgi:ATP-dependent Clp protease, protease subunit
VSAPVPNRISNRIPAALLLLFLLLSGCVIPIGMMESRSAPLIDYHDPVLNQRRIILTAPLDQVRARELMLQLWHLERQSNTPIDFYIATPGGDLFLALAVIDVIQQLEAPVNTWAIGNCSSAGAMLLASGTGTRYATERAVIVVHGPLPQGRPPRELTQLAAKRTEQFWMEHARLPAHWFPLTGKSYRSFDPETALRLGVIDSIAYSKKRRKNGP